MGLPRGSTQSGRGEATRSTVLCVLIPATFPGEARLSLARPGSSTWYTMPVATSWSEQRPSSRTPSSSLTLPPSVSGTSPILLFPLDVRRELSSLRPRGCSEQEAIKEDCQEVHREAEGC